jgi:sugar/nucleoside kinase (ribokinase family)
MNGKTGIAVAGTILVDKLNEIGAYPASGELTKILSVSRAVGGAVPNVGIDIKRVDPSIPVKAVGKIGKDSEGDFLVSTLVENGVDASLLARGEEPTSFTDVMSIVGGQRTFFTYPGACASFGFDGIDFDKLDVKMLHLGYFLLLDEFLNKFGIVVGCECFVRLVRGAAAWHFKTINRVRIRKVVNQTLVNRDCCSPASKN